MRPTVLIMSLALLGAAGRAPSALAQFDAQLQACMRVTDAMQRNQCVQHVQQQAQRAAQQQQQQQQQQMIEQQRQHQQELQRQMQEQQAEQQRRLQQQQQEQQRRAQLQQQEAERQKRLHDQQRAQAEQQKKATAEHQSALAEEPKRHKPQLAPVQQQATSPQSAAMPKVQEPTQAAGRPAAPKTAPTPTPEQKAAEYEAKMAAHKKQQEVDAKKAEERQKAHAVELAQGEKLRTAANAKAEAAARAQEDRWLAAQRAEGGMNAYPGRSGGYNGAAPEEQVACARAYRDFARDTNPDARSKSMQNLFGPSGSCREAPVARQAMGTLNNSTATSLTSTARAQQAAALAPATNSANRSSPTIPSSDKSRVIAGNGKSAMDCVSLETIVKGDSRLSGGGRVLANKCAETVEVTWCYVDTECARGSGNSWSIRSGKSYPVSQTRELRWAACLGANTVNFEKGSAGLRYICKAPIGGSQPRAQPGQPLLSQSAR